MSNKDLYKDDFGVYREVDDEEEESIDGLEDDELDLFEEDETEDPFDLNDDDEDAYDEDEDYLNECQSDSDIDDD